MLLTKRKLSKFEAFSAPYFLAFVLNTGKYGQKNLRIWTFFSRCLAFVKLQVFTCERYILSKVLSCYYFTERNFYSFRWLAHEWFSIALCKTNGFWIIQVPWSPSWKCFALSEYLLYLFTYTERRLFLSFSFSLLF